MPRTAIALTAGLALTASLAASAATTKTVLPRTMTRSAGGVRASLTYYKWPNDYGRPLPLLKLKRRGHLRLEQRVPPAPHDHGSRVHRAIPYAVGAAPLRVRDLDGDGEPEVLVDLFWGGSRCCMWTRIYRFDRATGRYRASVAFWGNFQDFYRLRDLNHDGRPELVARDERIESLSSTYDYFSPIRIFSFRHGRLLDVTRRYPKAVARDAEGFRSRGRWTRELLSAWVADEYLLGHRRQAEREIARALRLHQLNVPSSYEAGTPQRYVRRLHAFLRSAGYA